MLLLRDLPKYETLITYSQRYPDANPTAAEAYFSLLRVSTDIMDVVEDYYATRGTSQGRFTVLALLNRNPETPLNPADLARRAGVTRATMTGLLQGLEEEELIHRTDCSRDKRMSLVRLTRRGRKYVDEVLPPLFRGISDVMGGLTEDERQTLLSLLNKIGTRVPLMFQDHNRSRSSRVYLNASAEAPRVSK